MEHARSLARSLVVLLSSQIVSSALTLALTLTLPIYLGVAGLGRFAFAQAACLIVASVSVLGMDTYIVRAVAASPDRSNRTLSASLVTRSVLWASATLALAAFMTVSRGPGATLTIAMVLSLAQGLAIMNGAIGATFQGLERMGARSLSAVINSAVALGLGLPLIIVTREPLSLAAAMVAGQGAGLGVNLAYFSRQRMPLPRPRIQDFHALWRGSAPFTLIAVAQGIYGQAAVIVLGLLASQADVAWYASADRFSPSIILIAIVVMSALMPTMTRLHSADRHDEKVGAFRTLLSLTLLTVIPIAAEISVVGPRLYDEFYPRGFHPAGALLPVMAISWTLTAVAMVFAGALVATGRQRALAKVTLLMLGAFFVLVAGGIVAGGAINGSRALGATVGTLVAEALVVALDVVILPVTLLDRATLGHVAKLVAAGLAAAAVMAAAHGAPLIATVSLGLLVYAASVLSL